MAGRISNQLRLIRQKESVGNACGIVAIDRSASNLANTFVVELSSNLPGKNSLTSSALPDKMKRFCCFKFNKDGSFKACEQSGGEDYHHFQATVSGKSADGIHIEINKSQ
jgi:hypothetical protein